MYFRGCKQTTFCHAYDFFLLCLMCAAFVLTLDWLGFLVGAMIAVALFPFADWVYSRAYMPATACIRRRFGTAPSPLVLPMLTPIEFAFGSCYASGFYHGVGPDGLSYVVSVSGTDELVVVDRVFLL